MGWPWVEAHNSVGGSRVRYALPSGDGKVLCFCKKSRRNRMPTLSSLIRSRCLLVAPAVASLASVTKSVLCTLVVMAVAAAAMARTIIVAADGSGEFTRIANGVDVAEPGDTVLVRPGDYWDERFVVDSAVIVMAEQQGQATVWLDPSIGPVTLHSRAELRGFVIVGN